MNKTLYRKALQKIYKTIKEIDSNVLIIRYQLDNEEDDVVEKNEAGIDVMAKNAPMNYSKVIPNYLW